MAANINFHPGAEELFTQFDLEWIGNTNNTILGIDREFRILLVNHAYFRFAADNGGDRIVTDFGPGADLLTAIGGPQKQFYKALLAGCFERTDPLSHDYECSSSSVYRLLKMFVYPTVNRNALLLDHSLVVEQQQELPMTSQPKDSYIDEDGIMHQCGLCRRVRHNNMKQWDWLEGAFDFSSVSHGLCESCLTKYYAMIEEEV